MHFILKKIYNFFVSLRVPIKVKKNFTTIPQNYINEIYKSLNENYFDNGDTKEEDLEDHLNKRLLMARTLVVPWISNSVNLSNKLILEVGCGTGSSSVAFAEQGGIVTGIDVHSKSLEVAKLRANLLNLDIKFKKLSGTQVKTLSDKYDIIIYYASLEHMTIEERISSLRQAWNILKIGGYLVITEAPNRLWIEDTHTAELPFFQWLPDNLAYLYSVNSPKENFNNKYTDAEYSYLLNFLRRGRGVSFHEFELAFEDLNKLNVVSSLSRLVYSGGIINTFIYKKLYKSYLRKQKKIHPAFFEEYLDIIIKKI